MRKQDETRLRNLKAKRNATNLTAQEQKMLTRLEALKAAESPNRETERRMPA
jgi:hypothetical protein